MVGREREIGTWIPIKRRRVEIEMPCRTNELFSLLDVHIIHPLSREPGPRPYRFFLRGWSTGLVGGAQANTIGLIGLCSATVVSML